MPRQTYGDLLRQKFWQRYMSLFVRRCNGCESTDPHDSHLSWLGRRRYL